MKLFIITLLFCLLAIPAMAKQDRPLDVGVAISADPLVHEALYEVLKAKGISCSGLSTRKDGTVTIINSSFGMGAITVAEIQAEIDKIRAGQDIEVLIKKEIRKIAIEKLKKEGKIPQGYKDKEAK